MAEGPGKYDDMATLVRKTTKAKFVGVIVIEGALGNGFSMQGEQVASVPAMLRKAADEVEKALKGAT